MRKAIAVMMMCILAVNLNVAKSTNKGKLITEIDSLSYALGLNTGIAYRENLTQIPGGDKTRNNKYLTEAFKHGFEDDTVSYLMSRDESILFLQKYIAKQNLKDQKAQETAYAKQRPINDQFMAGKQAEGYNELLDAKSGSQYGTLIKRKVQNTGALIADSDYVCLNYSGKLVNGTEFDSSMDSSAVFQVDGVIEGLRDALLTLHKGDKAMVIVPSELGYGSEEIGDGTIPANSILLYDIEVLNVFHTEEEMQKYLDENGFQEEGDDD